MSGIYAPLMKAPENCYECPFICREDKPFWCGRDGRPITDKKNRQSWCDLVELPDGVRLIDANRLLFVIEKNFGFSPGAEVMQQLVNLAPTIIFTEGGK